MPSNTRGLSPRQSDCSLTDTFDKLSFKKEKKVYFNYRSYDLTKRKGVHAFSCGQFSSWIEDVNVNNDLCTYSPCTVINSLYWWMSQVSIILWYLVQTGQMWMIYQGLKIITCLMHGFLDVNVKLKGTFTSIMHWFSVVLKTAKLEVYPYLFVYPGIAYKFYSKWNLVLWSFENIWKPDV